MDAAELLLKNKDQFSNSACHCLYYSYFQLTKYVLKEKYNVTYQIQNTLANGFNNSHEVIKVELKTLLDINCEDSSIGFLFEECFDTLRRLRKKADYDEEMVSDSEVNKAILMAKKITKQIY